MAKTNAKKLLICIVFMVTALIFPTILGILGVVAYNLHHIVIMSILISIAILQSIAILLFMRLLLND